MFVDTHRKIFFLAQVVSFLHVKIRRKGVAFLENQGKKFLEIEYELFNIKAKVFISI